MSTNTDVVIDEKIKVKAKEPKMYKVIFLNDDTTPMEFVVSLLMNVFKHSEETSQTLTITIHTEGSGIAGVFTHEIAEQKAVESIGLSRQHGFQLQIKLEEE
jgi:ATP-dependent Clp protease adaptor protein ClpS|tara:strand:+ start:243 stop:548 length:306 start_codon:yes stop_codon:yes gene_type:complete